MKTIKQRLLDYSHLDPSTGCRLWNRCYDRSGYGWVRYEGKARSAHRVSYQVFVGPIPDGLCILHSCHTPACIEPKHLRVGTQGDNMVDRALAGRYANGERHCRSKLKNSEVLEIKRLYSLGGVSYRQLAKQFGIAYVTIGKIIRGERWKEVSCGA